MLRQPLLLTVFALFMLFPCPGPSCASGSPPLRLADAGQQTTELMKQSDYHNRVSQQKKPEDVETQVGTIESQQTEARVLDNFVIVLLVLSAGGLFLFSRTLSRKGSRRRRARKLPAR